MSAVGAAPGQRILVLGAGAIGGLIAAKLSARDDNEVALAVRRPVPRLSFTFEGRETEPPVRILTTPGDLDGAVDWVVVATKVYDTAGLTSWFEAPACSGAKVVVAQNGIEHVARLGAFVEPGRVLPMLVTYGAARSAPGAVIETLNGTTRIPAGGLAEGFAAVARGTGLEVELVDDFATALWTKLTWNLVGNSLTTIADVPVREIARRRGLRVLTELLVDECRVVANSEGAQVDEAIAAEILSAFEGYPETVRSSMWQDRDAGRPFEHDAISGAVVRAAERAGLDAPYSRMVTELLDSLSPGR